MKKKILFIEDEITIRETLAEALKAEGFEVDEASDGEKGIKKIEKDGYDLILLDVILPKKDGYEILKEKNKLQEKTPVILLTNLSGTEDITKALKLGAKSYLVKADYQIKEIVDRIKETLEKEI